MEPELRYRDHNSPSLALIQGLSVITSLLQRVSNRPARILVTMTNELHFLLFLYTFPRHILETWLGSSANSCISMFRRREVTTMFAVQLTSIDKGEWSRSKQTLQKAACHFNARDTPIFFPPVGCGERVQTSSEVCLLFSRTDTPCVFKQYTCTPMFIDMKHGTARVTTHHNIQKPHLV